MTPRCPLMHYSELKRSVRQVKTTTDPCLLCCIHLIKLMDWEALYPLISVAQLMGNYSMLWVSMSKQYYNLVFLLLITFEDLCLDIGSVMAKFHIRTCLLKSNCVPDICRPSEQARWRLDATSRPGNPVSEFLWLDWSHASVHCSSPYKATI